MASEGAEAPERDAGDCGEQDLEEKINNEQMMSYESWSQGATIQEYSERTGFRYFFCDTFPRTQRHSDRKNKRLLMSTTLAKESENNRKRNQKELTIIRVIFCVCLYQQVWCTVVGRCC